MEGLPTIWGVHYLFSLCESEESCSLDWVNNLTQNSRPPGFIAIGTDDFGNFFYLDVRDSSSGGVYLGFTPDESGKVRGMIIVGSTFSGFLQGLRKLL